MKRDGFTLLEVLFAVLLIAAVTSAAVNAIVTTTRSNGETRLRTRAVAAADAWLDRFRAHTLDFTHFTTPRAYPYGYDYGADPTFIAAGDPTPAALNNEWQNNAFTVSAEAFTTNPAVWRVRVTTRYHRVGEKGDRSFDLVTLVKQ